MVGRAVDDEFGLPVAGDLRLNRNAVLAGCGGGEDSEYAMHDGSLRRHAKLESDLAHIHQLAGGVAEFNEDIVAGGA